MLYRIRCVLITLVLASALPAQEVGYVRVMQGPMLGAVTPDSALVWARTSHGAPVRVLYGSDPWLADARYSDPVTPGPADDRTVVIRLTDLEPGTTYYYRIEVDGRVDKYLAPYPPFSMTTPPIEPEGTRLRIAFGSCFRLQASAADNLWHGLARWSPDLFLWVGDNIYGDALDPLVLAEEYRRIREVPALQPLLASVPQLAVWDDHDYGLNNHDRRHPARAEALEAFRRYWANGRYGLPETPGVFSRHTFGGVDLFLLDVRYHRSPNEEPDGPGKTMLGAEQRAWLERELRASRAAFKLLVSGSDWSAAKGSTGDAWSAFRHERDGLFDFIREHRIEGVVLVSGDTHMGELNAIPLSQQGGYDLYELVSSPLAQRSNPAWVQLFPEVRIRPGYSSSPNVGLIEADFTGEEPVLRFVLVDDAGRICWQPLELRASELRNGVSTWQRKIDPDLREAQARRERGEPTTSRHRAQLVRRQTGPTRPGHIEWP